MKLRQICLAGGCFWGLQGYFRRLFGVLNAEACYANGKDEHTSYYELAISGHAEAVFIEYDAFRISLAEILTRFISIIDPTSLNRQGNDVGTQYRSGIYLMSSNDLPVVEAVLNQARTRYEREIVVECQRLKNLVMAEEYHQDYLEKNPNGYCHIDLNLAAAPLDDSFKKDLSKLSPQAFYITQQNGTEAPFSSPLNSQKAEGFYLDITSGEPLFTSKDKFDSGSGWPSFVRPLSTTTLTYNADNSASMQRIEVRSRLSGAHLGHVFSDGLKDRGGLRYCINGAALEFLPASEVKQGSVYSKYLPFLI